MVDSWLLLSLPAGGGGAASSVAGGQDPVLCRLGVKGSLLSVVGHYAQWGGDGRGGLLRIGSILVGKQSQAIANKVSYHLLQCQCMNVQLLSLWIKVGKYGNTLLRNSFNVMCTS